MSDTGPIDVPKKKCECPHCLGGHSLQPFALVTFCPKCGLQHIDEHDWQTRLHRVHRCVDRVVLGTVTDLAAGAVPPFTVLSGCGHEWQPALVYTVGVQGIL